MKNKFFWALLPLAAFYLLILLYWQFTIDDAYISYRYAQNLLNGFGLVWNAGGERVEGYSNFLWALLSVVPEWAGLDTPVVMKSAGVIFGIGCLIAIFLISLSVCKDWQFSFLPCIGLAASPAFCVWAAGGLETSLYIFVSLCAVLSIFIEAGRTRKFYFSSILLGLLTMIRPEGGIFFIGALIYKLFLEKHGDNFSFRIRHVIIWSLPFIILFGGYTFFRYSYYGGILPNTVMAKKGFGNGARYVWEFFRYYAPNLIPFFAAGLFIKQFRREMILFSAIIVLYCAALFNVTPAQGFFYRFFAPVIPFMLIGGMPAVIWIYEKIRERPNVIRKTMFVLALIVFLVYPLRFILPFYKDTQKYADGHKRAHVYAGMWLRSNYPADSRLAVFDCGAIPYYSGFTTYDLYGLSNRHVQKNGVDVAHLMAWNPDIICLDCKQGDIFVPHKNEDALIYNDWRFRENFCLARKFDRNYYWIWIFENKKSITNQ